MPRAICWQQNFPRLTRISCFPVQVTNTVQSLSLLTLDTNFSALRNDCQISCVWHRLPIFPALDTGCLLSHLSLAPFPIALGTGRIISRAWHKLRIFPRLTLVAYFRACHWLHFLSRSVLFASFPALDTACIFSHARQCLPTLALVTNHISHRASHWLHNFPSWKVVAYILGLTIKAYSPTLDIDR